MRNRAAIRKLALLAAALNFLCAASHAARTHTVQRGETLSSIATDYNVTVDDLVWANKLTNKNQIDRGQKLIIPDDAGHKWTGTHVVRKGETLSSIATKYHVTVRDLNQSNRLRDADMLTVGQTLKVPGAAVSPQARNSTATTNPAAANTRTHTVGRGETLSSIATQYGVSIEALAQANNIHDADLLQRGQELLVPSTASATAGPRGVTAGNETRTHTVMRGETLSGIAASYGVTVRDLRRKNHLRNADLLQPGQKLFIPAGATAFIEHRVAKGESLGSIASRYKVAVADIRASNTLKNPNLIQPGQVLRIPASDTAMDGQSTATASAQTRPKPAADPRRTLPNAIQAAIDSAKVKRGRWKYIVIHHSAMNVGSAKGMDRYHREERHMENGLAYHFVIGNGNGMREGAIYVGRRWNEQLNGGHLAIEKLNATSIGICLVGNFEKGSPSKKQLDVLEALVRALQKKTRIPDKRVTTHKKIHPGHTQCPGKHFPINTFAKRLKEK